MTEPEAPYDALRHPTQFILNAQGEPVPEPDIVRWGIWFESATRDGSRIVGQEGRLIDGVEVVVSTVFLGMDHNWSRRGAPVLWESLVFGGEHDQVMQRYTSRQAAEAGHQALVADIFGQLETSSESLEEFTARVDRLLAEVHARMEAPHADTQDPGPTQVH